MENNKSNNKNRRQVKLNPDLESPIKQNSAEKPTDCFQETNSLIKYSRNSFWATLIFILLLSLLHLIEPEIKPTWRFISEYALGKYGWLMVVAFFAWAFAYVFLFFALRRELTTKVGKIGLAMMLVSAFGLLLAGVFTTDAATAETQTTSGFLHSLGGTLAMAMPLASLLAGLSLIRKAEWRFARRSILSATIFATFGFLVSAGSLGYLLSQSGGKITPDVWVGLPTRFEILTYCVWLITVSRQTIKINLMRLDNADEAVVRASRPFHQKTISIGI